MHAIGNMVFVVFMVITIAVASLHLFLQAGCRVLLFFGHFLLLNTMLDGTIFRIAYLNYS